MDNIYTNTQISPALETRLRAMPKIELHVHMEGATDAATVWELARRNHITLPAESLEAWQAMYAFRDFNHFIEIYHLACGCIQTPADVAYLVERFYAQQAEYNVRYCEAFISASLMLERIPQDEIIPALREGMRRGESKYNVRVRFIPDIARHTPETRFEVLDFVLKGKAEGIFIGIGLGGIESGYPPELFSDVYAEARRQGLHVVAHAGETEGPASMWGAIRSLQVERIGHGIRAVDDAQLVEHLRQTGLPLDVSPHSNYRLKVAALDRPHPIRRLVDGGVNVTVNSDDPAMFSTDLNQEYILLARQGFTWEELWQLNRNAITASFLSEEEKAAYRAEWQAFAGWI